MLSFLLLTSLLFSGVIPEDVSGYNKLSWFLQITDIHISTVQDKSRADQFRLFSQDYLRIYNPDLVICSGDLTDAKIKGGLSSAQVDEEWKLYYDIVRNRSREVPWLDIRGNHDTLNVLSRNSENNKFRNYSVMGRQGFTHSYIHSTRIRNQQYNFVGIDATLETGLRYPFNFVGDIPESEQNLIRNLTSSINAEDVTIFFGHYLFLLLLLFVVSVGYCI
ncbi:transmembrane protein 62-like [Eurytemora carolleeae]|uniref:transmembrane protein 62-like n=1 Tax=Eurytemora carolleeae TaxID=1294199 RepID=UPI000C781A50|nr:transmembrane protein 62-like [Eurytemora carolleeae]|eukprot:XP_023338950.1 transmembrane protein 62-like [Eurytemora affinis]